jgi:hypothetical protein
MMDAFTVGDTSLGAAAIFNFSENEWAIFTAGGITADKTSSAIVVPSVKPPPENEAVSCTASGEFAPTVLE